MRCPKCRFENPDNANFCNECGNKLELVCPNCSRGNPLGSKFCNECGQDLRKAKKALSVQYSQPQSYTPKFLADKIFTTRSSLEGERKLVTVLFADVANSTAIFERLDPEEVHQIMDECFRILLDEIHRYEGTANQFRGDGIMALFGAPISHEDHAHRACHAALSIQKSIGEYEKRLREQKRIEFKLRIGLNSGTVVVGSIGDDLRMDYTADGDITNLAARMEELAQPGSIIVSENTYKMVRDFFQFDILGRVPVRGKRDPQEHYRLLGPTRVETRIGAAVAKGLTKFVGRRKEIKSLEDAYLKAKSGSGQVVGVVGDAGVGKSRLLLELRNIIPKTEYTYLEGRCLHFGGSMAYLPVLDILRSYFEIEEKEPETATKEKIAEKIPQLDEKLTGIIPPFQELLSLTVEDEAYLRLGPKQKREKVFEAIRDLLVRESEERPLIVAIEDVHWVDKTSEEFLDYMIGWLANSRILLMLLYRPEYTHPWGSKSYYSKIGVDQLSMKSGAELIQSILDGGEVVPDLRSLILGRAGGNPLFMEEITRTLLENGSIQRRDNQYVLSREAVGIQIPDTIQGIIAARIDRLEDNLKRTMQVASVIGRDFAFRILQTITGMQEELKSHLQNLQDLEFIHEKRLFPELEYVFKHALTQEVAYDSLLVYRRKQIHEKIGKAIEKLYADRLEEFYEVLAYHYAISENRESAFQYLKLSGNKSASSYSNWEAFRFYKKALDTLSEIGDSREIKSRKIEILHSVATPMIRLGYPEDSLQILKEGEQLSKKLGDEKSLARFYGRIGNYYTARGGDPLLGIAYTEKCFSEAEKIQDIEIMAPVARDLCASYLVAGEPSKTASLAAKVIDIIDETKNDGKFSSRWYNVYPVLHVLYGHSLGWLGNFVEGESLCEKGIQLGSDKYSLYGSGYMHFLYGYLFMHRGDGERVIEHFQKSIRYCEEGGAVMWLGLGWTGLGMGCYFLGNLETARKHVEKGIQIQKGARIPYYLSFHYLALGMVNLDSGDLKKGERSFKSALKLSEKHSEKWVEGTSKAFLGRMMAKTDASQVERAEEYILEGLKILDDRKIKPWSSIGYYFLGELYTDMGQRKKALDNLKKAHGQFEEMGMDFWLSRTLSVLAQM